MKPMLWFVVGVAVALSGQALAESLYQDSYGNSMDHLRGYSMQPGQAATRDSRGYVSPAPVMPTPWHKSPC